MSALRILSGTPDKPVLCSEIPNCASEGSETKFEQECVSSIPPSPASQSVNWRLYSRKSHKCPPIAVFCRLARRLQAPNSDNLRAKSPIVSGKYLKYSRFGRQRPETGFDQDCVAGLGVLGACHARPPAKSLASSPPNPRADEDRDVGRGGMIVGPWRISQVVLFKLFARTAEGRESLF
jgi:hypothetical protein